MNEIYHDQSLGAKINVVLVRIIMLGYGKVRPAEAGALLKKSTETIALSTYSRNGQVSLTHTHINKHADT